MLEWIKAHWQQLAMWGLPAAAVLSTVLVKWIDFYGEDHPRAKRLLRFVLSLLSLLPARGAVGAGVRLVVGSAEVQIPGVSWSTTKPSSGWRVGKVITLLALLLPLAACGTTPLQKIAAANEAAAALRKAAAPMFEAACMAQVEKCKAAGTTVPERCAGWIKCRDARRALYIVIEGLHLAAAEAASVVLVVQNPNLDTLLAEVLDALARARQLAAAAKTMGGP